MGSIDTSVGSIGILEAGDGPAPAILFLHGVGSDKSVWRGQLDHFGRHRRAIAIDYPGYGESARATGSTREDYARAAIAVLDAAGIERAHVCGLSLGGIVAIVLHRLAPDRCASLILADTFAVHPDGRAIHERSVSASKAMPMSELAAARAPLLLGSAATPDMAGEVIATMASIDPVAYRSGAEAVWLADERAAVAAIDVPTLVLVGSEDRITPPALSQELARLVGLELIPRPPVGLETVDRAGHLANLERPELFNRAVEQFIARTESEAKG